MHNHALFVGVPALLSLPHFLYANRSYLEAVDGLNPSQDEHLTFVEMEPVSRQSDVRKTMTFVNFFRIPGPP